MTAYPPLRVLWSHLASIFGPYDEHIIEAINRAAKHGQKDFPKLLSVYIGVYSDPDRQHIEQIINQFKCKVRIYDAKTANVWGRT